MVNTFSLQLAYIPNKIDYSAQLVKFKFKKGANLELGKALIKTNHQLTKNDNGQTFLEFILLLAVLIGMSTFLMELINKNIAKRWQEAVELIASPDPENKENYPLD